MERERDVRLRQSADELEQAVVSQRRALPGVAAEERGRREEAIDRLAQYVALLRKAGSPPEPAPYWFKLEFPDGRWDVEEHRLARPPAVGDVVDLDRYGRWRVSGSQLVRPRPARKPAREFFVCAQVAG